MEISRQHWSVPIGSGGERIEFIRDWTHLREARCGENVVYPFVECDQKVVNASVFLSGFNIRQTRGGDSEVSQIRVESWVDEPSGIDDVASPEQIKKAERTVNLKLMYVLKDEDPTGDEDFNEGAIGFTVIAHTVPQK